MIDPIQTFLRQLEPTDCCQHGGLRAVRLGLHEPPPPALAVSALGAAVRAGVATLSEVGTGQVGRLCVHNRSGALLLGLAGELMTGGRQDRVLNSSVLIAPGGAAEVNVSCVEQRRWSDAGARQGFQPANATASTTVRSTLHHTMVHNLRQTGFHRADQGRVWQQVDTTLRRTGAFRLADTGALRAGLDQHHARLDDYARACAPTNGQVGLALFTPGAFGAGLHGFASVDCFASPDLLRHYAERLVRGAALEAHDDFDPALSAAVSPAEVAQQLLAALASAQPVVSRPAAGDAPGAQEHHYLVDGIVASVICHEGRPIHLAITPADESGVPPTAGGVGPGGYRVSAMDAHLADDDPQRPSRGRGAAFNTRCFVPSLPPDAPQVVRGGAAAAPPPMPPPSPPPISAPQVVRGGAAAAPPPMPQPSPPPKSAPGSPGVSTGPVARAVLRAPITHSITHCSAPPACQLRILCPGAEIRALWLPPGSYIIGRSSSCNILIDEPSVSRQHARLNLGIAGGMAIRDLGSSNGTSVNREPVLFASIKAGDVIGLGNNVALHLLDVSGQGLGGGTQ